MNEIKNCFYLNLDRRPDRQVHIENELNKSIILKDLYERFPAIDGLTIHPRSLPDGLITQNALEDILSDTVTAWGLSLTQGGLGVLLSYIELFKKISQLNGTSIIFEDDSIISENFDDYLTTVLNELPEDFDICYLGHGDVTVKKNEYSTNLSIPSGMIVCLPSLVVSPNGAKKILENLKNIDNQFDTALYQILPKLKAFVSNERIVQVKNQFQTDIQGNKNCIKKYKKQNYIFSTLAHGDNANNNAFRFARDLKYFDQKIIIVTNKPGHFKALDNVIEIEYVGNLFSYNKKIICIEEGLKICDAVIYIDSDTRIFYKNFKNTYTNFFIDIDPGFHSSWDWGKICRDDNRFFTSKDVRGRIDGYGELALETCKKMNINYEQAYHFQEGILMISKQFGREEVFLNTWKALANVLDQYEEDMGVTRLGTGEGNLIGLALVHSGLQVRGSELCNLIGESLKYNFWGIYKQEYLKNYPDRKIVVSSESDIIKEGTHNVEFDDKIIDLNYSLSKIDDNLLSLSFTWNKNNSVEFLDHEFRIGESVYHFNSDKNNEFHFENRNNFIIEHTYDWYGRRNWTELLRHE